MAYLRLGIRYHLTLVYVSRRTKNMRKLLWLRGNFLDKRDVFIYSYFDPSPFFLSLFSDCLDKFSSHPTRLPFALRLLSIAVHRGKQPRTLLEQRSLERGGGGVERKGDRDRGEGTAPGGGRSDE